MSDDPTANDPTANDPIDAELTALPDPSDGPGPRDDHRTLLGLVVGVVVIVLLVAAIGLRLTRDEPASVSADAANPTSTVPETPGNGSESTADTQPPATTPTSAAVTTDCSTDTPPAASPKQYDAAPEMSIDPAKTYTATMATSCGTIVITLDAKDAPVATNAFVFLAREGFYDGLTFHRVVPQFVIQGGDPAGDGSGGPGFSVAGEPPTDGYPVGSLAAAKTAADPAGTMGSQFFIVTGEQGSALPNDYARFGQVTEGLDVVAAIDALGQGDGPPAQPVYITSVTITEG